MTPARAMRLLVVLLLAGLPTSARSTLGGPAEMARAAARFLNQLTPEQRARASFSFDDAERLNWHFVPRERRGLPLKAMSAAQREAARQLLLAGVGERGSAKVSDIMMLEQVLRDMGGNPAIRDPELYFFSVFGSPESDDPWGWRVEGHHLSINFTVVGPAPTSSTPAFFGANPAHVRSGPHAGLRALAAEEDRARDLVRSLRADQRAIAIIATEAPRDIITGNAATAEALSPAGLAADRLDPDQSALLRRLVDEYLDRMAPDLAAERRDRLGRTDFRRITFAWAGSIEPGQPHYYRIQGPTFLIEYDNTQNDANHIHSVWRDFDGDFGRDLLREHYREAPHAH